MHKIFKSKMSIIPMIMLSFGILTFMPTIASATTQLQTFSILLAQIADLQAQLNALTGNTDSATKCDFTRDLTLGVTGTDVTCLQDYLTSTGHFTFSGGSTGYFGSVTKTAVSAWQSANGIVPAVGYFGSISKAKYNSLIVIVTPTPTTPTTPVPTTIVNIAKVTDENPISASIAKNASNFKMLDVKFEGDGTINSLTIKRVGFSGINDYAHIYLYKDGARLTDSRTFNSNDLTTFNNLNVKAPCTISVIVDFSGTPGLEAKIELTGDYNGLPIRSNGFTFVNINLGSVTITDDGVSLDDLVVGQTDAQIAQFKIYATGTESVSVKHVELYNGGYDVISNIKITDGSNTWSGILDGSKLIFNLNTLIKEGKTKTFKVYADISGDDGDTVKLYVRNLYDITAIGNEYNFGVGVISNFTTGHELKLVGDGTLEVKKITGDVQVALFGETKDILSFKFTSEDEPFDITDLKFKSNSSIDKLELYSNGIMISSEDGEDATVDFDSISVRVNGTKTFVLKAIFKSQENAEVDYVEFVPQLLSYEATGANSDNDQTKTVTDVVGKTVYVYPSIVKIESIVNGGTFTTSANKKVFGFKLTAEGGDVLIASSSPFAILNFETVGIPTQTISTCVNVGLGGTYSNAACTITSGIKLYNLVIQPAIPYTYRVEYNGKTIANGTTTGSAVAIATLDYSANFDEIAIAEGDSASFYVYVNTLEFVGDDKFIGVSMNDVTGAITWTSRNADNDGWLTSRNTSVIDTIVGLPIDPVEFN